MQYVNVYWEENAATFRRELTMKPRRHAKHNNYKAPTVQHVHLHLAFNSLSAFQFDKWQNK